VLDVDPPRAHAGKVTHELLEAGRAADSIVYRHVQQRLSLVPESGGGKALFAAADASSARLVSCDRRDLVSRGLAILPADALISTETDRPQPRAHDDTEPVLGPTSADAEVASTVAEVDEGGSRA
jgi:hypothetical protein